LNYLVTGSTATIVYGDPRFTNDLDVVIELTLGTIDDFVAAFPEPEFYVSHSAAQKAVERPSQFNIVHPTSGLKIDVIVASDSEFDRERLSRARNLPVLEGRTVSFASPEDVILKKLMYFKEGRSAKHLTDIQGVLRRQGAKLDRHYIAQWSRRLEVSDVWQQVLADEAVE
jgi:hypothetical protein